MKFGVYRSERYKETDNVAEAFVDCAHDENRKSFRFPIWMTIISSNFMPGQGAYNPGEIVIFKYNRIS